MALIERFADDSELTQTATDQIVEFVGNCSAGDVMELYHHLFGDTDLYQEMVKQRENLSGS